MHGFNNGNIQARSFLEVALEGFPWLSNANAQIVKEGTSFSCSAMVLVTLLCRKTGGLLEQTEDLASVDGEVPGVGAAVSHLQFISVSCFHFQASPD